MTDVGKRDTKTKKEDNKLSKRESLILEIQKELETYFLPNNIRQDAYLSSNMTADGYIDIKLLTRIKLIENLISNNDERMLIEAIRKSKILRMNSQETMVKYTPLIERKTLIIRDLPSNTPKKDVLKIFDNKYCSKPIEIHSDINNYWFITFNNEDECSKTCLYLQNNGKYKGNKLNVRIKTITQTSIKSEAMYSPDKYINNNNNDKTIKQVIKQVPATTLFTNNNVPIPVTTKQEINKNINDGSSNVDTQKIAQQIVANAKKKSKKNKNNDKTIKKVIKNDDNIGGGKNGISIPENECDYPGEYMRYTRNKFLKICNEMMNKNDLKIPETMRGRDNRIVTEKALIPISILPKVSNAKNDKKNKKNVKNDTNNSNKKNVNKKNKNKKQNYYNQRRYNDNNYYYDENISYNNQYYDNRQQQRYNNNNNYNNYYNNKQYKQYYKPKNSTKKDTNNTQTKKSNKNINNNGIIYAPTGKRNYYKGWKPKNVKSS